MGRGKETTRNFIIFFSLVNDNALSYCYWVYRSCLSFTMYKAVLLHSMAMSECCYQLTCYRNYPKETPLWGTIPQKGTSLYGCVCNANNSASLCRTMCYALSFVVHCNTKVPFCCHILVSHCYLHHLLFVNMFASWMQLKYCCLNNNQFICRYRREFISIAFSVIKC